MLKIIFAAVVFLLVSCSQTESDITTKKNITINQDQETISDGEFIEHHPNGKLKTKGRLKNGKRTGMWFAYYSNGNLYSENKYKKGELNGKTATYYPNGNLQYVGLFINNKKDDSWFFYLKDGTLDKQILFKEGEQIKTTTSLD
mgnify:CR=1 FL=1